MHHPFLENIYIESPQLVLYKYTQVAHNLPSKLLHSCSKTSRQTGYSRFAVLRAILSLQQASFLIPPPANSTKKIGLVGNCLQRLKSFRTQFRQRLWHDSCCVLSTHLQLPIIHVHSPEFLPPYSIYSSYIIWEKKLTKEPETLWNFMVWVLLVVYVDLRKAPWSVLQQLPLPANDDENEGKGIPRLNWDPFWGHFLIITCIFYNKFGVYASSAIAVCKFLILRVRMIRLCFKKDQKGTVIRLIMSVTRKQKSHKYQAKSAFLLRHNCEHTKRIPIDLFSELPGGYSCTWVSFSRGFECKSPRNSERVELIVSDHSQLNFWSCNLALNITSIPRLHRVNLQEMIA